MPEVGQIVVENLLDVAVVALCGEHDIPTAPSVETELDVAVAAGRVVIVDLSEASFINSSIVGVLFREGTAPRRIIAIAAPPGHLPRRLIDMVALTATVPTFDSRDAAIAYATSGGEAS